MRKIKKAISILLTAALITGSLCVSLFAETSVPITDRVWNMSSHGATAANITSDFEWNDLAVSVPENKYVSFDSSYMLLGGSGVYVKFKVAGPCNINIVAKNNSANDVRYVVLKEGETELATQSLPTSKSDTSLEYKYDGFGTELSLSSKNSNIYIKSISIEYTYTNHKKGDINGDKSINAADAAMVMGHIAGTKEISDAASLSAANTLNNGVIDIRDAIWILNNLYEEQTEATTTEAIDTSDGTEVSDYAALASAAAKANAKVYITADIEMESILRLNTGGVSLIGVPDKNGVLPVLNFENMSGATITTEKSSDSDVGIRINTAGNTIKNLVIEKAHDNGIQIKGTGAKNNIVENCIVRYNNDSGIQVTGGACNNTLKGVYSYRNCDVYTRGSNADGFAVKLSAGPEPTEDEAVMKANGNFMIDCYAWENGDDGWDSYDYPAYGDPTVPAGGNTQNKDETKWTYWLEYTNCMGWSNGDPANCLGYYDYINGLTLDEGLPFIMRFKALYPDTYTDFREQYNNGTLCSASASASVYYSALDKLFPEIYTDKGILSPSEIALSNWSGNPNCFKLGSRYTQSNSHRLLTNCIAFDHLGSGVDKNNSGALINGENIISFKNNINYHLSGYTAIAWNGIFGWEGTKANDLPTDTGSKTVSTPSSENSTDKEEIVRAAAERLKNYAADNKLVPSNVFDNVF